mgnify:CR=1 FL=1
MRAGSLLTDIRYALRGIRRAPLFAAMHPGFAATVPVSIGTTRVRYFAPPCLPEPSVRVSR